MSDTIFFRELLPIEGRSVEPLRDVADERRSAFDHRPWVYANMVTSLDGGVAIDGVSGALGGPADQALFGALRAVADVIIVGATTVVEEDYKPPSDRHGDSRVARGQARRPTIAILTPSLSIEPSHRVFGDPTARPIIITVRSASSDRRAALAEVADLLDAGDDDLDLGLALTHLLTRGFRRALLEGGPTINGHFVADDLIDEWNLSLSPTLAGGASPRAAHGADGTPRPMRLVRLWHADGMLFGRWVRSDRSGD